MPSRTNNHDGLIDFTSLDNTPGAWYVPQDDAEAPFAPPPTRETSPEPQQFLDKTWVQRVLKTNKQLER